MRDRFIGLDVHKATIAVAIAEDGRAGEIRHYGTIQHRPEHIAKLMKRLAASTSATKPDHVAMACIARSSKPAIPASSWRRVSCRLSQAYASRRIGSTP